MFGERVMRAFLFCGLWALVCIWVFTAPLTAQTCYTSGDMDAGVESALQTTAKTLFNAAAGGDVAKMRQTAISSLAANFSGIENAVKENQSNFSGASTKSRPAFLLKTEGSSPQSQEFLCGVFGANGQTANSAIFQIPGLPAGSYGVVTLDATAPKKTFMVTFVLQQESTTWKLAGFYVRDSQIAGHDANWFAEQARAFKAKGQNRNAYLYFLQSRYLMVPVDFMSTRATDRLYDEAQTVKPADLPPGNLPAPNGKMYKLTTMFPLAVGNDLELVVKFESADVSNTGAAFQDNVAVMKGIVSKYPEFRDAFAGVVVRGVEPSGRDYGTMLPMKDIK